MQKNNYTIHIYFLFVVLIGIILAPGCNNSRGETSYSDNKAPTQLPEINRVDSRGKTVKSLELKGKYVFVQFINSEIMDDIDFLEKVFLNWFDYGLEIIAIPAKNEEFLARTGVDTDKISIFSTGYRKLKKTFHSPNCCDTFYLYDPNGRLVKTGFNRVGYEEGVKNQLNRFLRNTSFHISEFVRENENLQNVPWLNRCHQLLMEEKKEFGVIAFLRTVCGECLSGFLTSQLMKLHTNHSQKVSVLSIIPSDYSDIDIENLKNFLNIGFRVERADQQLSEKWQSLISQFRESDLTNIVFLVDKSGTIIRVAQNDLRRLKDFIIFTQSLLKGERRTDS